MNEAVGWLGLEGGGCGGMVSAFGKSGFAIRVYYTLLLIQKEVDEDFRKNPKPGKET